MSGADEDAAVATDADADEDAAVAVAAASDDAGDDDDDDAGDDDDTRDVVTCVCMGFAEVDIATLEGEWVGADTDGGGGGGVVRSGVAEGLSTSVLLGVVASEAVFTADTEEWFGVDTLEVLMRPGCM